GAGYWVRIGQEERLLEFFVGETLGPGSFPGYPRVSLKTGVNPGAWHHVVATKDHLGNVALFLDGHLSASGKIDQTLHGNADTPFTIGAWNERFGPQAFFSGVIHEVSVYDRALRATEVRALFYAPPC